MRESRHSPRRWRCERGATGIDGDDFYSAHLPGLDQPAREAMSDAEAAASIIDWRRLRAEALAPLSERRAACYAPFDWEAYDGSLGAPKTVGTADVVIVEGVYSARPELPTGWTSGSCSGCRPTFGHGGLRTDLTRGI